MACWGWVRCLEKTKNKVADSNSGSTFTEKSQPGKGAAGAPGAGPCPELPFHGTVVSSSASKLIKVCDSPCVEAHTAISHTGTGMCSPTTGMSGIHCALCRGKRRRGGSTHTFLYIHFLVPIGPFTHCKACALPSLPSWVPWSSCLRPQGPTFIYLAASVSSVVTDINQEKID